MTDPVHDDLARWLAAAVADAEARGLPELRPLLEGLAVSTAALRRAPWNDRADAVAGASDAEAATRPGPDARR